ncbi:hypothetical protein BLNAU_16007 [Blattamonas nauphoetae]|uniref:U-box domain-containing protein n=1 Tax=Blattamonas nauphoetae TaxID=2049346 RepID=A0ABQ9X944_9EUKA|nr:hypothetical protein BLNAU_16007 [Blattamonas nauphoetae]
MTYDRNSQQYDPMLDASKIWQICSPNYPSIQEALFNTFWSTVSFDIEGEHEHIRLQSPWTDVPSHLINTVISKVRPRAIEPIKPSHQFFLLIPDDDDGHAFLLSRYERVPLRYHVKPTWRIDECYYFELIQFYEASLPNQQPVVPHNINRSFQGPFPQRPLQSPNYTSNMQQHTQPNGWNQFSAPSGFSSGQIQNPNQITNSSFQQPSSLQQNPQTTSHPYIPSPVHYSSPAPASQTPNPAFQQPLPPQQNNFQQQQNHFPPQQNHFQPQQNHLPPQQNHFPPQQDHFQPQSNPGFNQTPPQTQPQTVLPQQSQQAQISPNPQMPAPQHISPQTPQIPKLSLDEQKAKGYICAYSNQRITTPVTLEGYPNEFYERDVITKYIRENGIHPVVSAKKIDFSPFQTTTINPVTAPFPTWEHVFDHNNLTVNELLKGAKRQNIRKEIKDNAPFDFIPHFHGVVRLDQPLTWSDRCHRSNTATITVDQDSGFILNLTAADPEAWYCADHHAYTTSETQLFDTVFKAGTHLIKHKKWASPEEYQYVLQHGVNMFSFDSNVWTLLKNGLFLRKLLTKTYSMKEKDLLKFTTEQLGVELVQRSETLYHSGVISEIKTGDIFALHRLDGENQLRWYFTNSPITHVAIAVREQKEDGTDELFVYETSSIEFTSTVVPPWGVGFRKTPFMTWLAEFQSKGYSVAWLPIKQSLSDDFDVASATTWYDQHVQSIKNETRMFAFFDDIRNDIPDEFSFESFLLISSMLEAEVSTVQEGGIFDVKARLVKGLSQRLYHKHAITCTTLADCLNTIMLNGESAEDYFNQPEDDTWVYESGPVVSSASFVMNMLREGGVLKRDDLRKVEGRKKRTEQKKEDDEDTISFEDFVKMKTDAETKLKQKKTSRKQTTQDQSKEDLTEFVEWMSKFLNETEPLFNTNTAESNKKVNIQFNANELVEGDVTKLNIYDTEHLPSICSEGLTSKPLFCQLTGKYWMVLPQFNTVEPADNMFE